MDDIERISKDYSEITVKELLKDFDEEISSIDLAPLLLDIQISIDKLINSIEIYQGQIRLIEAGGGSKINQTVQKLELKKNLIYQDFFILQNKINSFINQKIIMTYVHVDPITGRRELRLFENNIENLSATIVTNAYGAQYAKLGYELESHYQLLKNSLPDEENKGLQITAMEVEARYERFKHRILWKYNNNWIGYKLTNRGPINEAFTAFFIHEIQLKNGLHENINTFMTLSPYGVIYADNANGFLIGDVSLGGLQFAVKGAYGSPQNFTLIVKELKKLKEENFSMTSFYNFLERFTEVEREKATSIVKPLSQRSISAMVRHHESELLKSLTE